MALNQVKAGAALNYVIIALNTVVGLLYTPYMLRMLGQNEYGLYSLVSSVIAYLTLLDFGFGNAIVRYTAKFRAEGKTDQQWRLFGMFVIVYSIIGFVAFCGGMVLYFNTDAMFDRAMTPDELSQAQVMMLLLTLNLALTFPLSVFGSIITAYENFVFQRCVNILRILLSTGVMIALLAVGFKAVALVVVQSVFSIGVLLVNWWYCRRKLHIRVIFGKFDFRFLREIGTYSFWIFLNAIMDRIYWGTGQFVLGAVAGTAAVAVFSVAIILQQMYLTFSVSISSVLLPKVTAMSVSDDSGKSISDLFIRTGRFQCIVLAMVLSGFIVFGRGFISLWAGSGYSLAYTVTVMFFAALFVPLIQNTGIVILQARNHMKFRSLLYLGISLASLGLQIWLAGRMGVIGCAIAICAALVAGQWIAMNIYYAVHEKLDIMYFWRQTLKMLAVPVIMTVAGLFAARHFDFSRPGVLIAGIGVFSVIYIPLFWKFGMNSYERDTISSSVLKVIRRLAPRKYKHTQL